MPAFTSEEINETAARIVEKIGPTLELADLAHVVPEIMEIMDRVSGMSGEEKHKTAVALLTYVLENTDTPWLPDSVSDPLFLKVADLLLIPLVAKAARGDFAINRPE